MGRFWRRSRCNGALRVRAAVCRAIISVVYVDDKYRWLGYDWRMMELVCRAGLVFKLGAVVPTGGGAGWLYYVFGIFFGHVVAVERRSIDGCIRLRLGLSLFLPVGRLARYKTGLIPHT